MKLLGQLTVESEPAPNMFLQPPRRQSQSVISSEAIGAPSPCSGGSAASSPEAQFEGESSLSAHTAFANSVIERAVSTAPLKDCSPEMASTLQSLRQLVDEQKLKPPNVYETTYRRAKAHPHPGLSLDRAMMLPIEPVMAVLRIMQSKHFFFFFHDDRLP